MPLLHFTINKRPPTVGSYYKARKSLIIILHHHFDATGGGGLASSLSVWLAFLPSETSTSEVPAFFSCPPSVIYAHVTSLLQSDIA